MFKINCEKVTESGEKLKEKSKELKEIMGSLQGLEGKIADCWKGTDSENFLLSFNKHNQELSYVVAFLKNHSELFKQCAEAHDQIDIDYGRAMSS